MKNNNLIECGVSFIVALFSYLIRTFPTSETI